MSENKKIIAIPEEITNQIHALKKEFDTHAAIETTASRSKKIAKLRMFNEIESVLPELSAENYSIDYDTMEVTVKDEPPMPDFMNMLKGMNSES